MRRMPRCVIIGLDGAEPALVEAWMREGQLPNLAAIAARGAYLPLQSTTPPATFPAWTTCVTGVNPGRHGIFDFTEILPGAHALRFVNASHRKAPALWTILSAQNKRVAALGVPGSYPPEPVNGVLVAGFDSPVATHVDASFVHPARRYPEFREWTFADFQESHIGPGWHDMALPRLLAGIARKEAMTEALLREAPWDFFMVVFGESDTVSHHFWMFHDPGSPRHRPGRESAILQVYRRLDTAVGKLAAAAGEDALIMIVSDHGFGGASDGVVHLNNWLAETGRLRFRTGARGSALKRAALALTPPRARGALFRRFPGWAARAESASRFGGIDWRHTRAWSEELNYFPSIRINLAGRDAGGIVPQAEYGALVKELCEDLEAWEPVRKAWPRDALYKGPELDRAPDIVLELALENGYAHSALRARGGPSFRRIRPDEALGGKERGMNGSHRPVGVLLLSRPPAARRARLEDIAPTVLAHLGSEAPPMDGRNLLGPAPRNGRLEIPEAGVHEYSETESRMLEERLRALGYFE